MREQLDAERTSSRRSLVRAGAWTVPAITAAVAAPAYAASRVGYFEFGPGSSSVSWNPDGYWVFTFVDAAVWVSGRDLKWNELTMTASFVPDPGSTADELRVFLGGPAGFSAETAGTKSSASYTYELSVGIGDPLWISDGTFFGTALGIAQVGSFLLTFSAPGFAPTTFTAPVPQ